MTKSGLDKSILDSGLVRVPPTGLQAGVNDGLLITAPPQNTAWSFSEVARPNPDHERATQQLVAIVERKENKP